MMRCRNCQASRPLADQLEQATLIPQRYSGLSWRTAPPVPPDLNGPLDVPFDPLPADFAETPIFTLFAAAAARDPTACALIIGDERVSYGALVRRVLDLAPRIETATPSDTSVAILLASPA